MMSRGLRGSARCTTRTPSCSATGLSGVESSLSPLGGPSAAVAADKTAYRYVLTRIRSDVQEFAQKRGDLTIYALEPVLGGLLAALLGYGCQVSRPTAEHRDIPIKLDQEEKKANGGVLNPSTQSVNRYHSRLRELKSIDAKLMEGGLVLRLHAPGGEVMVENLNPAFIAPLLPYPHAPEPDAFDRVNLMLAEYARNGVSVSPQEKNTKFAYFRTTRNFLEEGEEYLMEGGELKPNATLLPRRFGVTNMTRWL